MSGGKRTVPGPESDSADATVRAGQRVADVCSTLLVMGEDFVTTMPLPEQGELVIGRGDDVQVQLADRSVSRRHARLVLGSQITIEDLGSANGTRVGERTVAPGSPEVVAQGDVIEVGTVMIVVRSRRAHATLRSLDRVDAFEAEIERRAAAPGRRRAPFAVLRIVSASADMESALRAQLRPEDAVTAYARDDHAVLLPDVSANEAAAIAARLRNTMRGSGGTTGIGVAMYPDAGTTAHELLAAALAAAARAAPAELVVDDSRMAEVVELVDRMAAGSISVLLTGETGVGKEVLAERIHDRSERAGKPLLRLNCAALTESLLEAELFGYDRGAFTGAATAKPGLLETADGGTLFLDEIGDLPISLQAKLLRVLEDGQVRRVGGLEPRTVDVRLISATHKRLLDEANVGRFRTDLYYRLSGVVIEIPPLRERRGAIPALVTRFLERAARRARRSVPSLDSEALAALIHYDWPGNVRELRNTIERALLLCRGDLIDTSCLPREVTAPAPQPGPATAVNERASDVTMRAPKIEREVAERDDTTADADERERIVAALARVNGNQTRAARLLGIARSTLVKRMDALRLPRPRKDVLDDDGSDS